MIGLEAIVAELEVELKADGYDAGYYAGIHEAISIITKHLTAPPSEDDKWFVERWHEIAGIIAQCLKIDFDSPSVMGAAKEITRTEIGLQSIFPEGDKQLEK